MQTQKQEKWQKTLSAQSYKSIRFLPIVGAVVFIFTLLALCSAILPAQGPINSLRTWTKEINLAVGSPIENENTEKAIKAVEKIPGLKQMVRMYNEKFGNDSVHAERFVDREPDEKNTSDPIVRDYYEVVFVSDSVHQVSRWWNFLVRKDFQEVRYYDLKKAKTTDLNDWKQTWPANAFLKEMAIGKD